MKIEKYSDPIFNGLEILGKRMSLSDVRIMASRTLQTEGMTDRLWQLTYSDDRKVAVNCLWILTHLDKTASGWLMGKQEELIGRLLTEEDQTKKRIFLQLLREQEIGVNEAETVRLLDFCFSKINAECEPYAVRCFSIYIALKICRRHEELISELEQYLEMLSTQSLSPGLRCALRTTQEEIRKLRHVRY